MADDFFDPASTLGPDDPLRSWADQNLDWSTGRLLQQDPSKAIDSMIKRGIPPPDVHADGTSALGYAGEAGMGGAPDPSAPIRTTPDGKISGNITSPTGPGTGVPSITPAPVATPGGGITPQLKTPVEASDDSESATLKKLDLEQDLAQDAEDENKKKTDAGDALAGFSKSLSGVKAPTPPPLNAVGTPGAPHPGAISAPNISNLISILQSGAVPPSVAPALGKLLVQGKA